MKHKLLAAFALTTATVGLILPQTLQAHPHERCQKYSYHRSHRTSPGLSISFSTGNYAYRSPHNVWRSPFYSSYRTTRYVAPPPVRVSIADVQYALNRRGYHAGRIDGIYGARTARAIRCFQLDHHLHPSGSLTQNTLRALGF